jgi:tetratricopeptide (TPR) repeat protein
MRKHLGKPLNAGILFFMMLSLYGFSDATIQDIETAIMKQEYQEAKQLAEQSLSGALSDDQANEVRYYLGLCNLWLEQYPEAREIFTDLTKKKIGDMLRDKAYLGLFDSYYMEDQYEQADQIIQRLLKISPQSELLSLIYLKYARVNLKMSLWDDAHTYLEKIIAQFPESLEAHTAKQLLNEKQYFAVQVGAFIERGRAEQLTNELKKKGEYAYIVETSDQKNRIFYRVRVGQLALLGEAQELESKLSKAGYPTEIYP